MSRRIVSWRRDTLQQSAIAASKKLRGAGSAQQKALSDTWYFCGSRL